MSIQNGANFLLIVCDTFSKFLMVRPLKSKKMGPVAEAFRDIFEKERHCLYLRTDLGLEFFNREVGSVLKEFGVHHYGARHTVKASQAERYVKTLKSKIYKFLTKKGGKKRYIDDLPAIVKGINNSVHRSIKMKPANVTLDDQERIFHLLFPNYYTDYPLQPGGSPAPIHMLKEGEVVRMSNARTAFDKGYKETFSGQLYIVDKIIPRSPPLYELRMRRENGGKGDEIIGTFYGYELKRVIVS